MIAILCKTSSNLRHDGCFFTKRAIAAGRESQSQIGGHPPNPTDSGMGVSPVRTRRPPYGRDARATCLRAGPEVGAPVARFRGLFPRTALPQTRMTNDQIRKNDKTQMTKPAPAPRRNFSTFGLRISFVIRYLSFRRTASWSQCTVAWPRGLSMTNKLRDAPCIALAAQKDCRADPPVLTSARGSPIHHSRQWFSG
jgi:hypothetical protein